MNQLNNLGKTKTSETCKINELSSTQGSLYGQYDKQNEEQN